MKISNRPELYKETVDVLYEAYFNGTLRHGDGCGCAIGNIVKQHSDKLGIPNNHWVMKFGTFPGGELYFRDDFEIEEIDGKEYLDKIWMLITASGYGLHELINIEHAFESAPRGHSDEDWMFNGLVAVLAVLEQIHGVTDDTETLPRFKNHYSTLTA